MVQKGRRNGFRVEPLNVDGPRHLGEAIHDDQQVLIPRLGSGEGTEQVHTQIRQRFRRGECLEVVRLAKFSDAVPRTLHAVVHERRRRPPP